MSIYMTEEEQIDAIRQWWKRHQNIITTVLLVVLLCALGVKYWFWHKEKVIQQASTTYEQLLSAFSNQDDKAVKTHAEHIVHEYGNTVYADAARMALAKSLVQQAKYSEARKYLNDVAQNSKVAALKQVASIRVARILFAEKSYDQALSQLAGTSDEAYAPMVHELQGDIYAAKKEFNEAMSHYRQAVLETQKRGMANAFLDMKLHELAGLEQTALPVKKESNVA